MSAEKLVAADMFPRVSISSEGKKKKTNAI